MRCTWFPLVAAVTAMIFAAPARADVDADFNERLHSYGVYGPRDYNAWLGKIMCKRLDTSVDADAQQSARFVARNLPRTYGTGQSWQFVAAAIDFYCPEKASVLERVINSQEGKP